jgi:DNA-binding NarL/FixJ family response regulator
MAVRLLIVDDVADVRFMMRIAFDFDERITVVAEAANGVEAVAAAAEHHPEAVLLDLMMPVMDGFTAIPHILEACPSTRIVVYSGMTAEVAAPALEAGAVGFVEKGLSPTSIAEVICDLCA